MITKSTKLKRGTIWLYNGVEIVMERDRGDGTALIIMNEVFEDVDIADLKPIPKGRSVISNKPKVLNTDKQKLNEFYSQIALRMPYECENCGQKLQAFNKFAKRSCSAHIFPKSSFPSIAMNEDNILFMGAVMLGGCGCHNSWDSSAYLRSKMKIYPIALERFKKLKEYLTPKEIIKASTYLNLQWQ